MRAQINLRPHCFRFYVGLFMVSAVFAACGLFAGESLFDSSDVLLQLFFEREALLNVLAGVYNGGVVS